MGKIKFISEEFLRSFQQSLIKNILLMIMFSICLFMAVVMSSYYLDLGEREEYMVSNYGEDGEWYNLMIPPDLSSDFERNLATASGSRNLLNYYEQARNIENHPILSVNTTQAVLAVKEEMDAIFQGRDHRAFVREGSDADGFGASVGDMDGTFMSLNAAQFDARAFEFFGLKTSEGEGITVSNTTLKEESDCIPIVMGAGYDGMVSIGKKLHIAIDGSDYICPCKVVGILEKDSRVYDFGRSDQEMVRLDSCILFPYGIRIAYDTDDNKQIARYAYVNLRALWNSQMRMPEGSDFKEVAERLGQIGRECQLAPLQLTGMSAGLILLQNESAGSVRIMFLISLLLAGFTFYAMLITFWNKIQDNQEIYGIYLLNGCSAGLIVLPFILEIAVILMPSLLLVRTVLNDEFLGIYNNFNTVINLAYGLILGAFVAGVFFLLFVMRFLDTEYMLRNRH